MSQTDPADASYTKIFIDGKANWIKPMPGTEKAAAFLETHRCANLVGASIGFTRLEGTTVNIKDKIAYSALQNIQGSMMRGASSWRESTGITVEKTINASGNFAHNLAGAQKDLAGTTISNECPCRQDCTQGCARRKPCRVKSGPQARHTDPAQGAGNAKKGALGTRAEDAAIAAPIALRVLPGGSIESNGNILLPMLFPTTPERQ